ncbi:redoxin family protein [Thiohalorhabdus methylotrophus]|uniref:Redoxin family protein n=1 Tax=Thiohalorhabdus methylotrophus TaxID=3242694 RepID=A0ABV4TRG8_9GAMM
MLSVGLGPLAFSVGQVLIALATGAALAAAGLAAREPSQRAGPLLLHALLVGVIMARVAFVLGSYPQYQGDWFAMLDMRDGGFLALPGAVSGAAYLGWWFWRAPSKRRPLAMGILVGSLVWGVTAGSIATIESTSRGLPQSQLATLEGDPAHLGEFRGKPMVVNLWASWCPPCRREMPLLEQAQDRRDGISFVFVNQGEGLKAVGSYLNREGLELDNVLLDRARAVGAEVGANGLPTTLFYNRAGHLVDAHTGMLSEATLHRGLKRIKGGS